MTGASDGLLHVELQEKHERLCRLLREHQLDGVWLAQRENIVWYTGGGDDHHRMAGHVSLLVMPRVVYAIMDSRESQQMPLGYIEDITGAEMRFCTYDGSKPGAESELLDKLVGPLRMGADTLHAGFVLLDTALARLSRVLTIGEQYRYGMLCHECTAIVEHVARSVTSGQTEWEIAAQIAYRCFTSGITPAAILVEADDNARPYRHADSRSNHVFQHASLHLVGAQGGLYATVARVVAVDALSAETRSKYRALARRGLACLHGVRPGRLMAELREAGAAERAGRRAAHRWQPRLHIGVTGYRPHIEEGHADARIEPHQAVALSLSLSSLRLENTLMVLPEGNEVLTMTHDWPMIEMAQDQTVYYLPDILRQ